jgi:hypothetical protein
MTYLKWALGGAAAGGFFNVVWALQDFNYYVGTMFFLLSATASLVLLAKKVR